MASNKPRTRFTANLNENSRTLFSVDERQDGDLIAFIPKEEHFFDISSSTLPGEKDRYAENRISVHRSTYSDGRTIKHTMRTADGSTRKTHSFVRNSKSNLCWPMFSRAVPALSSSQYDHKPKAKDKEVIIGIVDENVSTLLLNVFVMSKNRTPPSFRQCRMTYCDFKFFRIVVYSNYVNFPAWDIGATAVTGTLPQLINDAESHDLPGELSYLRNGGVSLHDLELEGLIFYTNQSLARGVIEARAKLFGHQETKDFLNNRLLVYSNNPMRPETPMTITDGFDLL